MPDNRAVVENKQSPAGNNSAKSVQLQSHLLNPLSEDPKVNEMKSFSLKRSDLFEGEAKDSTQARLAKMDTRDKETILSLAKKFDGKNITKEIDNELYKMAIR